MRRRSYGRLAIAFVVGMILIAPGVEAEIQLPFFKKKKKEPPPAEAPAPGAPAEAAAPGAPAPPPAQQPDGKPAVTPGQAPAISPTSAQATPAAVPPGGQRQLTPEEQAQKETYVKQAQAVDAVPDTSVAHVQERMTRWRLILTMDPTDTRAQQGYGFAKDDLTRAEQKAATAGTADQTTMKVLDSKVNEAKAALLNGDWRTAEQYVQQVLQQQPSHLGAKGLEPRIDQVRRASELKRLGIIVLAVLAVIVVALVAVGRWGLKIREERQKKREEVVAKRAAVLQVVDGISRGKLITIDKDKVAFKIGAASGAQEAEKNDLILSDSAALVSRFHCNLIRKDGDYYLVDSSMNGTLLNGKPVGRGEHERLEDGDEITIAEVSRLKFLYT